MGTKAFARYTLFLLLAAGILITASSVFTQKGREEVTPAQVTEACKEKKPGDTVKLGGQDITCQTPTPQVAQACHNKKPGAIVKVAQDATCQTPAVVKACQNKKPGDTVKVGGKDATCQTPEATKACQNKKPGVTVRMAQPKPVSCPPACCYINGCSYPQNRECL